MKKFTLIEVLVVVAIIGILASLLLPTLKNAREKSRAVVCRTNLKQIGQFSYMASDDNGGYSQSFTWNSNSAATNPSALIHYTGTHRLDTRAYKSGLYHCPSIPADAIAHGYDDTSYAINGNSVIFKFQNANLFNRRGRYKFSQISNPSSKIYFSDGRGRTTLSDTFNWDQRLLWRWHGEAYGSHGKANALWFDGHVSVAPGEFLMGAVIWNTYFGDLTN